MDGHGGVVERLAVGVAKYECHVMDALTVHVVDCVAAAAAHADDFDDTILFGEVYDVETFNLMAGRFIVIVWHIF
jgi:hypothetical protein